MNTGKARSHTILLLLIGLRNHVSEANVEVGFARIESIAGRKMDTSTLHQALSDCLRDGLIRDPVRLPEGSLQCHWHLELTPKGVEAVRALMRERGMTADQLLNEVSRN